jgi:hypothetical protein
LLGRVQISQDLLVPFAPSERTAPIARGAKLVVWAAGEAIEAGIGTPLEMRGARAYCPIAARERIAPIATRGAKLAVRAAG